MSTPVLVTGATGFLGAHLAGHLVSKGHRVRVLARPTSDLSRVQGPGLEIVHGDVEDAASVERAAKGCEVVHHCAGRVSDWGTRDEFFRVNAGGTRHVVEACRRAGVRRLVHVGSLTVLGLPRHGRVLDETEPMAPSPPDFYTQSKQEAERLVRAANGQGLETVVVRPGVIWGPRDHTILPRILDLLRRGRMPYLGGGHNVVAMSHMESLSRALAAAAELPGAAGGLFHVTDGEEHTAREVIDALAAALDVPPPRVSLPVWGALALAGGLELGARVLGRREPPPLTRYGVRLVSCHARWNIDKARRELGYVPATTFLGGVEEAVRTAGRV